MPDLRIEPLPPDYDRDVLTHDFYEPLIDRYTPGRGYRSDLRLTQRRARLRTLFGRAITDALPAFSPDEVDDLVAHAERCIDAFEVSQHATIGRMAAKHAAVEVPERSAYVYYEFFRVAAGGTLYKPALLSQQLQGMCVSVTDRWNWQKGASTSIPRIVQQPSRGSRLRLVSEKPEGEEK